MKRLRPIRGAQEPPLIPNDVQPECICVPKVYDWVQDVNRVTKTVPLPDGTDSPPGCRELVEEAIAGGQVVTAECSAPDVPPLFPLTCAPEPPQPGQPTCRVVSIQRTTIPVNGQQVPVAIVRMQFNFVVNVTIFADGTQLCNFDVPISVPGEVVLCLPEPLDETNINCRITAIQCNVVQVFDGAVELDLIVCKDIQVEAEVKLEVLAKFCKPRQPIPVPPPVFECPTIELPPQCPELFPQVNCDCQAELDTTVEGAALTVNGVAATGTLTADAIICNQCMPEETRIEVTFTDDTPTPVNESFTFRATSFDNEICVTNAVNSLTLTGTGTVTDSSGNTINGSYTLVLVSNATCTFALAFTGPGFTIATPVAIDIPCEDLTIRDCANFPTPLP
ncbi:hypothetical protein C8P63_10995 [Melghirimyces profundicolus]|uniref:Uncharacterized protein n=1 Tax=Melghirimyces profundicolus TaxID=1242148 RepID=A0A2T6BW63_9BACL|nr:hypothetical protein [Melghirimyces profundicolus]PTX60330.1 hypothetical protein C8P63_10995 [Melghirimyces profundicolus]